MVGPADSKFIRPWQALPVIAVMLVVAFVVVKQTSSKREYIGAVDTYEEGRAVAKARGRALMVNFTADWCEACKELEHEVFEAPVISERLYREFVVVSIDYDAGTADTLAAIRRFEVSGLPRVAFESRAGEFHRDLSFEGKVSAEEFLARLDQVLARE